MPFYSVSLISRYNQFLNFFKTKSLMGSIESKIKEGYQLQMAPVFHSEVSRGQKPLQNLNQFFMHQQSEQSSQNTQLLGEEEASQNHNPQTKKPHIKLTKILSTLHRYPYSTVGLIKSMIDGQEINGTGTIIGKRHVLTCAHNCYSIKENKAVDCLTFFPSYNPSKNSLRYPAKNIFISPSFQTSLQDGSSLEKAIANDYAIIELDTGDDLEDVYGSLGIDFSEELSESEKQIIGYTKRHLRHSHLHCYKGEGYLQHGIIKYDMPAGSGMGGSPIVEERDGQFYIIGLHVYYMKAGHQKLRGGLKMSRRVLENMEKWVQEEVETVDLKQKCVEKEGLRYISRHNWKKLARLTLVKCHLSSNCGKYLRKGNWTHLTHLDLGGNDFGKEGVKQFSQGDFRSLRNLSLWGNNIGKGGAYYLTLARLDSLQNLNLYNNQLCYDGVQNLSQGKWPLLILLQLGNNSITSEALAFLMNTCWANLESVNLWGNGLEGEESMIISQLRTYYQRFKYLTT